MFVCALSLAQVTSAGELKGPGRFCGYSPIIDLLPGERVTTLVGGIHGGSFLWEGRFGSLEVNGIGLASRPPGKLLAGKTSKGHVRFKQRFESGEYVVAIWNERQGAAYFSSAVPITARDWAAIDRVDLFQEGEDPEHCNLRTIFSWE